MAFKFGGVTSSMAPKDVVAKDDQINYIIKDSFKPNKGNYFMYLLDKAPNVLQKQAIIKEIEKFTDNYILIVAVNMKWQKEKLKGNSITEFFIKHRSPWRDYLTREGKHVDGIMAFGAALYSINNSADIMAEDFLADKFVYPYFYRGHQIFPVDSVVYPVFPVDDLYPAMEGSNVNYKTRFFYKQNERLTHPENIEWLPDMTEPVIHVVKSPVEADQVFKDNMNKFMVAFDTETNGFSFYKNHIHCLTICWDGINGYYIPWEMVNKRLFYANVMSCEHRTGANPKFDLKFFYSHGVSQMLNVTDATDIAAHAINSDRSKGLKPNTFYFTHMGGYDYKLDVWKKEAKCNDYTKIPTDILSQYATMDAITTWRVQQELWKLMDRDDRVLPNEKMPEWTIRRWYEDQMMRIYNTACETEYRGIFVNWDLMNTNRQIMYNDCVEREKKLKELWDLPDDFNLYSTTEIGKLFEKLGFPEHGRSKNGCYATNDSAMTLWIREGLEGVKELRDLRTEYSSMNSFLGTPVDGIDGDPEKGGSGWLDYIKYHPEDNSHRIHQSYNVMGTTSFRFIGRDPNFQNIPTHSDFAHYLKECIDTPPDDLYIVTSDSGKEYRLGKFERLLTQRGYIRADELMETDTIIEDSEKPTVLRIELARVAGGKYHTPEDWWFNKNNEELKTIDAKKYLTVYDPEYVE